MSRLAYHNLEAKRITFIELNQACHRITQTITDVVLVLDGLDPDRPLSPALLRLIKVAMRNTSADVEHVTPAIPFQLLHIKARELKAVREKGGRHGQPMQTE